MDAKALADSLSVIELRLLAELCETKSLAVSAARLGVNVSSASRTLTRLRKLFDDQLFLRCGSQMVATKFMQTLRVRLEAVLHGVDSLMATPLDFHPSEAAAVITIAAIDNAFAVLIAPWLGALRKEAPGIEYVVKPIGSETLEDLRSGQIDLVIGQDLWAASDPKFHRLVLLRDPHVILVREKHAFLEKWRDAYQDSPSPDGALLLKHLQDYDAIVPTIYRPSGVNQPLRLTLALNSDRMLQIPYFLAGIAALSESDAFMIMPSRLAAQAKRYGRFEVIPLAIDSSFDWQPGLLWHQLTDQDPLHQWFRSKLISYNRTFA